MGYYVINVSKEERSKWQERAGLEGPYWSRAGKVYYYDPKAGKYYDPTTDFYIEQEEASAMLA